MGRCRWADMMSEGYEFKIIERNNDDMYCRFRVSSQQAIEKPLTNGTLFMFYDEDAQSKAAQIVASEISSTSMYSVKITGTCILRWLSVQPSNGTSVFYS